MSKCTGVSASDCSFPFEMQKSFPCLNLHVFRPRTFHYDHFRHAGKNKVRPVSSIIQIIHICWLCLFISIIFLTIFFSFLIVTWKSAPALQIGRQRKSAQQDGCSPRCDDGFCALHWKIVIKVIYFASQI